MKTPESSDICVDPSFRMKRIGGLSGIGQTITIENGQAHLLGGKEEDARAIATVALEPEQAQHLTDLCNDVVFDENLNREYLVPHVKDGRFYEITLAERSFLVSEIAGDIPPALEKVVAFGKEVASTLRRPILNERTPHSTE